MVNILSVIWLDFAFFGTVAGSLFGGLDSFSRALLVGACCFVVCYFTLRFGVRGIVFADSFQSPLIALGALVVIGGFVVLFSQQSPSFTKMVTPMLPVKDVVLFVIQLTFLNIFINLVTESHWLRLWIFKEKEIHLQWRGMIWTALLWGLLAVIGLFASELTGQTGMDAVIGFLGRLNNLSIVFIAAFWIGAMAALFASADAQIYSFMVVQQFNSLTGKVENLSISKIRPLLYSIAASAAVVPLYWVVEQRKLSLDQLVFLIFPVSLNLFPAFVRVVQQKRQSPYWILVPVVLFSAFAIISLIRPGAEFYWRLLPPFMPLVIGLIAWWRE